MKIVSGKNLTENEISIVNEIALNCGILFDTARLLFYRGVNSVEKANIFLNPNKKYFHNPYLFNDMDKAVERIKIALTENQNILIFGDYDADGICATSILYYCLKSFGINARYDIPEREDGYGINYDKICKLHTEKPIDLLITVDCGVSEYENIEKLKKLGIDVIVTDHHEPPEILPDCIVINPKIKGQKYPFDNLCGGAVAYKLGYALIGEKANEYLDFVALSTIADSMELIDENRSLVFEGLKIFNSSKLRPAFSYLLSNKVGKITAQSLAFVIAPRVNAGGRMGDAHAVLELFTTDNVQKIYDLSVLLNEYNISRQFECDLIYQQAKEKIEKEQLFLDEVIVVDDDNWKTGFIGIVAAKLVEDYNRPVIVFGGVDGELKGSARSISSINIFQAISLNQDLLNGFGGHSQAAGLSIYKENLFKFKKLLCSYIKEKCVDIYCEKQINIEWEINEPISLRFAEEIELLEPFGLGNKKPIFSIKEYALDPRPLKENSPHFAFNTKFIEMLNFNGENDCNILKSKTPKRLIFELNLSTFKNKNYLKGYLKRILPDNSDTFSFEKDIFTNEIRKIRYCESENYNYLKYEILVKKGYGTIYVLNSLDNLRNYNNCNLSYHVFEKVDKNNVNCFIISPICIPKGYTKIVYLEKPVAIPTIFYDNAIVEVYNNTNYNLFNNLSCDRETFKNYYNLFCSKVGEYLFIDNDNSNVKQFIFCLEVFIELGFFAIENDILSPKHCAVATK